MTITPTRCGSVTLHKTLVKNDGFSSVVTNECGENTIHGTYNSIDNKYFEVERYVLLLRNPISRLGSIFSHYRYKNIEQFLDDFDQHDKKFRPCTSYLQRIDDTIKTETMRSDVNRIFDIDFEELDVIYENPSKNMCVDCIDTFRSLSRTIYNKDVQIGGYGIA